MIKTYLVGIAAAKDYLDQNTQLQWVYSQARALDAWGMEPDKLENEADEQQSKDKMYALVAVAFLVGGIVMFSQAKRNPTEEK